MTNEELLQRFETATLTSDEFPHRKHVRVAWIYLNQRPLHEVLDRFPRHLKQLAAALGADGLYHETITCFFILLVNDRMARGSGDDSWAAFADANTDLFDKSGEIMSRFYEEETWKSDLARKTFVLPDRRSA